MLVRKFVAFVLVIVAIGVMSGAAGAVNGTIWP